jgi:hypothetical protein
LFPPCKNTKSPSQIPGLSKGWRQFLARGFGAGFLAFSFPAFFADGFFTTLVAAFSAASASATSFFSTVRICLSIAVRFANKIFNVFIDLMRLDFIRFDFMYPSFFFIA